MKFTKQEKEIIKRIASGEVFDIVSYLKTFNLTTFRKLDKKPIEERFEKEEDGATYKIYSQSMASNIASSKIISGLPIEKPTPVYDYEEIPASLDYSTAKQEIETCNNTKYFF